MKNISLVETIRVLRRGINNYRINRPLVVSFEVTLSCNANCRHCDCGGIKRGETRLEPEKYGDLASYLNPPVVQISGGEPLLRENVVDIIRAIKKPNGLPFIIFVTNGSLLNKKKYLELRKAGVDQFSVSLDFPNEKHDNFRRFPGLYSHLEETIPGLANFGYKDIVLNSAITRDNLMYLLPLAKKAQEWDVSMSYSAYSILRIGDKSHSISSEEDLGVLQQTIGNLIKLRRGGSRIVNPELMLWKIYKFFEQGFIPNCKAGLRFLVVMPDGYLTPCSHHRRRYLTQERMIEEFSKNNKCGGCYVAIRGYTEISYWALLKENLSSRASRLSRKTSFSTAKSAQTLNC